MLERSGSKTSLDHAAGDAKSVVSPQSAFKAFKSEFIEYLNTGKFPASYDKLDTLTHFIQQLTAQEKESLKSAAIFNTPIAEEDIISDDIAKTYEIPIKSSPKFDPIQANHYLKRLQDFESILDLKPKNLQLSDFVSGEKFSDLQPPAVVLNELKSENYKGVKLRRKDNPALNFSILCDTQQNMYQLLDVRLGLSQPLAISTKREKEVKHSKVERMVKLGFNIRTQEMVAIKRIFLKKFTDFEKLNIKNEIEFLRRFGQFRGFLIRTYNKGVKIYLIQKYFPGNSIDKVRIKDTESHLLVRRQLSLLTAMKVKSFHDLQCVHRDLKPLQILCSLTDSNTISSLEIIDLETVFHAYCTLERGKITDFYAAPDVFKWEPTTVYFDIYSLGLILSKVGVDSCKSYLITWAAYYAAWISVLEKHSEDQHNILLESAANNIEECTQAFEKKQTIEYPIKTHSHGDFKSLGSLQQESHRNLFHSSKDSLFAKFKKQDNSPMFQLTASMVENDQDYRPNIDEVIECIDKFIKQQDELKKRKRLANHITT